MAIRDRRDDRWVLGNVRAKWLGRGARPQSGVSAAVDEPKVETAKDEATREKETLLRRELYVAITRACDGLWVGVV